MTYDVSNEKAVSDRTRLEAYRRAEKMTALRQSLHNSYDLRALLWDWINRGNLDGPSFDTDPAQYGRREGHRDMARFLRAELDAADVTAYLKIQAEAIKRRDTYVEGD